MTTPPIPAEREPLCTSLSAFWCPRCGDCTCQRAHNGECCFDEPRCPLHGERTAHAQTVELADAERLVKGMAAEQGIELTARDEEAVSRFAQLLFERARKGPPLSPEAMRLRKQIL